MNIFRGFDELKNFRNPVVTTGSFDGVHVGHKTIINRLKNLASLHNGETVLITFHPHPRKVLYPETTGKSLRLINTTEEKMILLQKAGVDNVIIAEFNREFSKITCEEFVRDLLVSKVRAKVIVVGFNHHFGCNRAGDYNYLWNMKEQFGFEAEEIPAREVEHETVSSTRIRKAISDGYIQRANAYLDSHYMVMARSEKESGLRVKQFKFCQVAGIDPVKLVPPKGIYAVSVISGNTTQKGVALICENTDGQEGIYFYTPGIESEPDGHTVILNFHKKIQESINLHDENQSGIEVASAIKEVSELIF